MKRNETIEKLHTVFNSLAPDSQVQDKLTRRRREMEAEHEDDKAIILMITHAIVDGLRFGNW